MKARLIKDISEGKCSKSNGNNPFSPSLKEKTLNKKKRQQLVRKILRRIKSLL